MITKDHVVNGACPRLEHHWRPCPVSELHHTHGIGVEHSRARTHAPSTSLAYTRRIDQAHEISTWFDQPNGQRSLRKTERRCTQVLYPQVPRRAALQNEVNGGRAWRAWAAPGWPFPLPSEAAEPSRAQQSPAIIPSRIAVECASSEIAALRTVVLSGPARAVSTTWELITALFADHSACPTAPSRSHSQ